MAIPDPDRVAKTYRVGRKDRVDLDAYDPGDDGGLAKGKGRDALATDLDKLDRLQEKLYASARHAVLVVIQAMDTGGKDGMTRRVLGPLNAQGVRVTSFKRPTDRELAHDFLWRVHREAPPKGMIGVFNRSHYEDVLVPRVHDLVPRKVIEERYEQINDFEKLLAHNGTAIVKIFLHISRSEQKERLQARLDDPEKHWKFDRADLAERKLWKKYMHAYEHAISACNTRSAPWYVVPANHKWYRNLVVARIMRHTLEELDLEFPKAAEGIENLAIDD